MKSTFTKHKDFVWSTTLDLPGDIKQIREELANEEWIADQPAYGQAQLVSRYKCLNPKTPAFRDAYHYILSPEFKNEILDTLYGEEFWPGYWGISKERMANMTNVFATPTLDKPGFDTKIHLDNRMVVATGILYFIDGDDPKQSTTFYSDDKYSDPVRMPTGYGAGWLAANMHNSWHSGQNHGGVDRYLILYGLSIRA